MSVSRRSAHMNVMVEAAEKAGRSLAKDFGEVEHLQVSRKGPGDFVSTADHKAEKTIRASLEKARPTYGFLMEEGGTVAGTDPTYRWIVDPLDGTNNFLHGIPHFCTTIALEKDGEIIAGVTYDPIKDELFTAEKGLGAFMNNRRLRVAGRTSMSEALSAFNSIHKSAMVPDMQNFVDAFNEKGLGLRSLGSAALDLAYVASGRLDAYWDRGLNPWDRAAGALLIREAGGRISTVDGDKNILDKDTVIAGNPALHDEMMKKLGAMTGKKAAS